MNKSEYFFYATVACIIAIIIGSIIQATTVDSDNKESEDKFMYFYSAAGVLAISSFSAYAYAINKRLF